MSFFGRLQQARRRPVGEYIDGIWTEGDWSAFTFIGTIQPLTGKQFDRLPEERRERAGYNVFTATALRSLEDGANPDQVYAFGRWHEVVAVEPWQNGILPHYKAIIQQVLDPLPDNPPPEEEP